MAGKWTDQQFNLRMAFAGAVLAATGLTATFGGAAAAVPAAVTLGVVLVMSGAVLMLDGAWYGFKAWRRDSNELRA